MCWANGAIPRNKAIDNIFGQVKVDFYLKELRFCFEGIEGAFHLSDVPFEAACKKMDDIFREQKFVFQGFFCDVWIL